MMILFIYVLMFVFGYFIGHEYARFKMESGFINAKKGYEQKITQLQSEVRSLELKLNESMIELSVAKVPDMIKPSKG